VCLLTSFPVQMSDGRASVLPRSLVMCMPASSTPQTSSTPQYYGDTGGAGGAYPRDPRVVGHARLKRFAEGGDAQLLVCQLLVCHEIAIAQLLVCQLLVCQLLVCHEIAIAGVSRDLGGVTGENYAMEEGWTDEGLGFRV